MGLFDKLFRRNKSNEQNDLNKEMKKATQPETQSTFKTIKEGSAYAYKIDIDKNALENLKRRFIAFDVETTGLSCYTDRIIEMGAVVFENGVKTNEFGTLVNSGIPVSPGASAVNHITDEMLKSSPTEEQVYPKLIEFLGDSLKGETALVAHNAKFDMDFLTASLKRLGYDASIYYADTLSLSRKYIKNVENYKQGTIAEYFGITNSAAHRAASDAETCGRILLGLIDSIEAEQEKETERKRRLQERNTFSEDELEICARIRYLLMEGGKDVEQLKFHRASSSSIHCNIMYSFFSFKLTKKGRYALIPVKAAETSGYRCDACTLSEGGSDYKRVYFQSPSDLDVFADYICKSFTKEQRNMRDYLQHHRAFGSEELETLTESWVDIDDETMNDYLNSSEKKDYSDVPVPEIEDVITINDVEINAVHNRCPFETIVVKEYSWDDNIFEKWRRGEELRQAGQHLEAIAVYEECRSDGMIVPYLYTGFAKAYHSLKDYDNEIVILEEGIKYFKKNAGGDLITRRDSAIKALYKKQQAERIAIQKKAEKEAKKQEKERADAEKKAEKQRLQQERARAVSDGKEIPDNPVAGRAIYQMDDEGNIIAEYISVSLASKTSGVNPKSIRDAAKGVQKHAGGFVWRYKDQIETD